MSVNAVIWFEILLIAGSLFTFALWEVRELQAVRRSRKV